MWQREHTLLHGHRLFDEKTQSAESRKARKKRQNYGKDPIITMDFYLTNVEPREWILPTPLTNNKMATSTAAAASNLTPEIPPDLVQPGEIRLHSWMLYTSWAPVLDL